MLKLIVPTISVKVLHCQFYYLGGNEAATVAYAAHCQQEKSLDRPIAGHTNICPASITDGEKEIAMLTSTIKHELLHALGFSLRFDIIIDIVDNLL